MSKMGDGEKLNFSFFQIGILTWLPSTLEGNFLQLWYYWLRMILSALIEKS